MKAYAFSISTDECFDNMFTDKGNALIDILKRNSCLGVWQHPDGWIQVFMFKTIKQRDDAFELAKEADFNTAELIANTATIDERWVPNVSS